MHTASGGNGAAMEQGDSRGMDRGFSGSSPARDTGTAIAGGVGANTTGGDLFAFGGNPAGSQPFPRGPRAGIDIDVSNGAVSGQRPPAPQGASTFIDPARAPLTGHYCRLSAGTPLPAGFDVCADGADVGGTMPWGHRTVYPTVDMTFDEFAGGFRQLAWQYGGKI